MKVVFQLASLLALLALVACKVQDEALSIESVACTDPRPGMCTREYRPVCGLRDTGVRCITEPCPSAEHKTYGNACDACADTAVYSYEQGACEAE